MSTGRATLTSLPPELLLHIAENLLDEPKDFCCTSRYIHNACGHLMFRKVEIRELEHKGMVTLMQHLKFFLDRPDRTSLVQELTLPSEESTPLHSWKRSRLSKDDIEYAVSKAKLLDLAFEPDLVSMLQSEKEIAYHYLLLHILPNLRILNISMYRGWFRHAFETIGSDLHRRLQLAAGDPADFLRRVPQGMRNLREWNVLPIRSSDPYSAETIIPGLVLPSVKSVNAPACRGEISHLHLNAWRDTAAIHMLHLSDSMVDEAAMEMILSTLHTIRHFVHHSPRGNRARPHSLMEQLTRLRTTLRTIILIEHHPQGEIMQIRDYEQKARFEVLREFTALSHLQLPLSCCWEDSNSRTYFDVTTILPAQLTVLGLCHPTTRTCQSVLKHVRDGKLSRLRTFAFNRCRRNKTFQVDGTGAVSVKYSGLVQQLNLLIRSSEKLCLLPDFQFPDLEKET